MKLNFTFTYAPAMLALVAAAACARPTGGDLAHDGSDAQRLAALVDYVGADYGGAVSGGIVVVASEYEEQTRFTADARRLAVELVGPEAAGDDPLLAQLAALDALVRAKADPTSVASAARNARESIVGRFQLPTVPDAPPSLARAEGLYRDTCAVCHGSSGKADTERAVNLNPRPVPFSDSARLPKLSPYRVYNALTFGVRGTAMPSFELLSASERWDLAFFVLRLGHQDERRARAPVAVALADMARATDADLLDRLRGKGIPDPRGALAYVRVDAAFSGDATRGDIETARRLVRDAAAALTAGRAREADRLAIDAYLQGFEPLEAGLRARDPGRVQAIEAGFRDFRGAIASGGTGEALARADSLERLFDAASGDSKPTMPFTAAALIFFREGIEAALLIGALLAAARKLGRPDAARYIHAGWIAAIPAGVATWWLLEKALSVGADRRELLEAVVALTAAAVLFSVSFWMISRAESRRWLETLKRQVARGVDGRSLVVLAGLSFLALYREAAETILFTQALILESGARKEVWAGAAVGTLVVAGTTAFMTRAVVRLPLGPFFGASGILLCGLAVSFAGSGMHILVASGYLSPRPVPFPDVPWLGVHPDVNGLAVQVLILAVVAGGAVATLVRSRLPAPVR